MWKCRPSELRVPSSLMAGLNCPKASLGILHFSQIKLMCFLWSWVSAHATPIVCPWATTSCSAEDTALDAVLPLARIWTWQCFTLSCCLLPLTLLTFSLPHDSRLHGYPLTTFIAQCPPLQTTACHFLGLVQSLVTHSKQHLYPVALRSQYPRSTAMDAATVTYFPVKHPTTEVSQQYMLVQAGNVSGNTHHTLSFFLSRLQALFLSLAH